jgi:N-acetylglucosaminyldiphosphoundecaprenol N-acetyl-beta-D-mannosaminyltransferase
VVYVFSPPFRLLRQDEKEEVIADIRLSGCRILMVGLGCPKQERWMAEHRGVLSVVMLGVGAAFDFISGEKLQAPYWLQRMGLEWVFRLVTEPRRLWFRYFYHNPRFLVLVIEQLLRAMGRGKCDHKRWIV